MSDLKNRILATQRRSVPITIGGEVVHITIRKVTAADLLGQHKDLLSAYGDIVGASPAVTQDDAQAYAVARAVLLAGVVDPPLDNEGGADRLTPEDLGLENWAGIFQEVAQLSDLGLMFQGALTPEGIPEALIRPGTGPSRRRKRRRN